MTTVPRYDAIVLGSGISALTMALGLQRAGRGVLVIDKPAGAGASGLPGGLANPASGRQAREGWRAEECLDCLLELPLPLPNPHPLPHPHPLQHPPRLPQPMSTSTGAPVRPAPLRQNGILRPATSPEQAKWFQEVAGSQNRRSGWMEWLDAEAAAERFPEAASPYGGLWLPRGITMHLPSLLEGLKTHLGQSGVEFIKADSIRVAKGSGIHTVTAGEHESVASVVVFAAGAGITGYPQWSALPLGLVKGQVVEARLSVPGPDYSVASSGYSAFTGRGTVVTGSTYEHNFASALPDEATGRKLVKRLAAHCPGLEGHIVETRDWAGIRATTPDRKPWVGRHWSTEGFYCITGMGSHGLLMAPLVSKLLSNHITEGTPLPAEIDVQRLYKTRRWRSSKTSH